MRLINVNNIPEMTLQEFLTETDAEQIKIQMYSDSMAFLSHLTVMLNRSGEDLYLDHCTQVVYIMDFTLRNVDTGLTVHSDDSNLRFENHKPPLSIFDDPFLMHEKIS